MNNQKELTIRELLQLPTDLKGKLPVMGVEVEVERLGGPVFPEIPSGEWVLKGDGSLRVGAEYVSTFPRSRKKIVADLENLKKALEDGGIVAYFSDRTSVHVHLNIRNLTLLQLKTFVYVYYLLEIPLMRFCGDIRSGNQYCLRACDSDEILWTLAQYFSSKRFERNLDRFQDYRYAALNVLYAMNRYGSVEFRGMRGTLDIEVLDMWLSIIESLYLFVLNNTRAAVKTIIDADLLFETIFNTKQQAALACPSLNDDLALGKCLAIDLLLQGNL